MQSIEQTNKILYSDKKEPKYTPTPSTPTAPLTEKLYFTGYRNYTIYYKAFITKYILIGESEPVNAEILTSYETEIAIYYNFNLLVRKEYYNCSRTTKEQLEHYISIIRPINIYYLNESNFKILTDLIKQNKPHPLKLANDKLNLFVELEKPIFNLLLDNEKTQHQKAKEILNDLKIDLNLYLKGKIKLYKHILEDQTTELKTREKHEIKMKFNNIEFIISFSCRKKSKKILTKFKLKIIEKNYFTQDLRTYNEKLLYDGYDMGVTNTKELKRVNNTNNWFL